MKQLFLDNFSLLRVAKGVRARTHVLDTGGTKADANNAFQFASGLPHSDDVTLTVLEDYPHLNEALILLLESDLEVWHLRLMGEHDPEKVAARDALWDTFELTRRMTAYEAECLVIPKS